MPSFLGLRDVCKGYGRGPGRVEVLRDINLSVCEGEFVAIVGYSGAGKTTLMALIAGLTRPDMGSVLLEGRTVERPGHDRALVFQNYSLLPWLTVYQNVELAVGEVFPKWSRQQRREHVDRHLAMVNLTPARHKKPAELSGGMRQRVSVARALAMDPRVLLLDEPLSALDALTRATLQDEIEHIWERDRKTVVLITNDVDEAILLADRIIPLSAGPAATLGPAVAVELDRPRDRKAINHCPQFKRLRNEVISYLLGEGGRKGAKARTAAAAAEATAASDTPTVAFSATVPVVQPSLVPSHASDVRRRPRMGFARAVWSLPVRRRPVARLEPLRHSDTDLNELAEPEPVAEAV